jgi:hypothetical protein
MGSGLFPGRARVRKNRAGRGRGQRTLDRFLAKSFTRKSIDGDDVRAPALWRYRFLGSFSKLGPPAKYTRRYLYLGERVI